MSSLTAAGQLMKTSGQRKRTHLFALVLVLVSRIAAAAPARVVLADPDPELRRAIERALAPWKIEVVVDPAPPDDGAQARADAAGAQFVVWRSRKTSDLVVYDREHDTSEERPARSGALDPVAAASLALTVKTLLRLPPLPAETEAPAVSAQPTAPAPSRATRVVGGVAAAGAVRVARGSETDVGARALISAWVQPLPPYGLRLAIVGDVGTATDIAHASFKGSARDWAVLASAGWVIENGAWELEPSLGAGVLRATLSGTEMMSTPRDEAATLATLRAVIAVRRRWGRWTAGALVGVDVSLGTPTYTRSMGATIFEVPGFSVVTGLVLGAELGR